MKRTGVKAYQLADLSNITRSSLYRYLRDEQDLFLASAEKIRKAMALWEKK